jgi:hypothetical protein
MVSLAVAVYARVHWASEQVYSGYANYTRTEYSLHVGFVNFWKWCGDVAYLGFYKALTKMIVRDCGSPEAMAKKLNANLWEIETTLDKSVFYFVEFDSIQVYHYTNVWKE